MSLLSALDLLKVKVKFDGLLIPFKCVIPTTMQKLRILYRSSLYTRGHFCSLVSQISYQFDIYF